MRIETPQILWHNGADNDNGKNAPLYSAALLPVGTDDTSKDGRSRHVLATAGNSSEIHLWEVSFSREGNSSTDTDTDTGDDADNKDGSSKDGPKAKRQRILQSASSSVAAHNGGKKKSTSSGPPTKNPAASAAAAAAYSSPNSDIKHLLTLTRQIDRGINCIKFSPDGCHLAAVGYCGLVVVFTLPKIPSIPGAAAGQQTAGRAWANLAEEKLLRTQILPTPLTSDVMDISWSSDSKRFVVGCLDHTVVVYENSNHGSSVTSSAASANALASEGEPKWRTVHRSASDHNGYVQGVAYDPLGVYVASQGSDRTVRVYGRKKVKVVNGGKKAVVSGAGGAGKDKNKAEGGGGGVLTNSTNSNNANENDKAAESTSDDSQPTAVAAVVENNEEAAAAQEQDQDREDQDQEELQKKLQNQAETQKVLTESKFELGKGKLIKFRNNSSSTAAAAQVAPTGSALESASASAPSSDLPPSDGNAAADSKGGVGEDNNDNTAPPTSSPNQRRPHLYADESTVESFFRRLSFTPDGSFLVTPAALWHPTAAANHRRGSDGDGDGDGDDKEDNNNNDSSGGAPTFATYLFARHSFDGPCRVLAGLEKPSIVIRPNPVLFKLPPLPASDDPSSSSKENDPATAAAGGDVSKTTSGKKQKQQHRPTHRSIFAVLTRDTVLVYDTYHTRPLSVARGLHYSGLTDAAWSDDGRNLVVTSTDGYISILGFEDGELGEVYTPPAASVAAAVVATPETEASAVTPAQRPPVAVPLPPCDPGQTATIVAPPAKKAKTTGDKVRIAPTLVAAAEPEAVEASTCSVDGTAGCADSSYAENKKAKRRVVLSSVVEAATNDGGTIGDDKKEEKSASHTEVVGGVTNLSLEGKKGEDVAAGQEPKKKKKRVQPMLVSCEQ